VATIHDDVSVQVFNLIGEKAKLFRPLIDLGHGKEV